ncbi:MAG: ubiquitin-like small modifier protein 1 [Acidimicrobiales bacterium]
MSVTVRVPSQLRTLTGGESQLSVPSGTVRAVIDSLDTAHRGLKARLLDEQGQLRRHVNVFVADEDVRYLDGLDTTIADGETVSIVPAVAGG